MGTTLHDKTISKSMALHKETPLPQFNFLQMPRDEAQQHYFQDGKEKCSPSVKCYQELCPRL